MKAFDWPGKQHTFPHSAESQALGRFQNEFILAARKGGGFTPSRVPLPISPARRVAVGMDGGGAGGAKVYSSPAAALFMELRAGIAFLSYPFLPLLGLPHSSPVSYAPLPRAREARSLFMSTRGDSVCSFVPFIFSLIVVG